MKASELVKKLEREIEKHGDLPVEVMCKDCESGYMRGHSLEDFVSTSGRCLRKNPLRDWESHSILLSVKPCEKLITFF